MVPGCFSSYVEMIEERPLRATSTSRSIAKAASSDARGRAFVRSALGCGRRVRGWSKFIPAHSSTSRFSRDALGMERRQSLRRVRSLSDATVGTNWLRDRIGTNCQLGC